MEARRVMTPEMPDAERDRRPVSFCVALVGDRARAHGLERHVHETKSAGGSRAKNSHTLNLPPLDSPVS